MEKVINRIVPSDSSADINIAVFLGKPINKVHSRDIGIMAEEQKIEKVEEECSKIEDQSHLRPQIIASLILNIALLSCGLCYSWADLFLPQGSWEIVALPIGAIPGAIVSALLVDFIGRKWSLYLTSGPLLASWILMYLERSWPLLFTARLLSGLSVGAIFATIPVYIGELVETRIRGTAIGMMFLFFNLGRVLMSGVGPILDKKMTAIIGIVPPALLLLSSPWIPESPYYDVKKGKDRCAALSLSWLRRTRSNEKEMDEIKALVKAEQQIGIQKLFAAPVYRKTLSVLLLLIAGQQLSGCLAVQIYTRVVLLNVKLPVNLLLITSVVSLVASIISTSIADILGRKPIFLISSYVNALSLLAAGAYFLLDEYKIVKFGPLWWIPLIPIALHIVSFNFGLAPIPHIISSEIFAIGIKSWANAVIITFASLLAIILGKTSLLAIDALKFHVMFFIFGAVELLIAVGASICMQETRRKSFREIQEMLNKSKVDP